jgi:hypothetical protein
MVHITARISTRFVMNQVTFHILRDEVTLSVARGERRLEYLSDKELMSDCEHPQSLVV